MTRLSTSASILTKSGMPENAPAGRVGCAGPARPRTSGLGTAMNENRLVTVCSECLRASCWHGYFYCENYVRAGTVQKTVTELRALALENSRYWSVHR
jgi:hypothetical protein